MPREGRERLETASMGGVPVETHSREAALGFEPGARIGDYEIVARIGAGGMGEVYRVRNVISDRTEAMKVLLPSLTREPDLAERFTREIKVQASMQHPNIASLHTAFHFNNQLVMIMEFLEGTPLDQRLHQGPISLPDCLRCVSQVLSALSYAHQRGVIHRDIKPSNIMLMPDGSVKLMDFGIAQVAQDPKLTGTGVTVGSPYYMSPEQIRGETPDARSDIYSLGITLYELVTGRRPIEGDSEFSIKSAHLHDVPTPPIALDHTLPAELNDIILMAIAKLPERRFQTADAFQAALKSVSGISRATLPMSAPVAAAASAPATLLPHPPQAGPSPPPMPVAARPKSHRALYMAAGAIAAVIVLALAALQGPKYLRTSAREQTPAAATSTTKTAQNQPAPVKPAVISTPVASEPAASAVIAPPAVVPVPAPVQAAAPDRKRTDAPRTEAHTTTAAQSQPPAVPARQAAPPPPAPLPPAPSGPSAEDIEKVETRIAQMGGRMSAIDRSLQRLEQSQNSSGLGLRADFGQARDLLHSFFGQAESAMRNQDVAAANRHLDRAEVQLDKLAKALNQ